jgi:hypothetical protein
MDLASIALQGLEQSETQLNSAIINLASFGASSPNDVPLDTTDLVTDITALMSVQDQFSINLNTLNAADRIQKNTVDLFA